MAKRCDSKRISFFNYLKQNYLMNQQKIRSGISDFSILSGHKMVCFFEIQVSIEVGTLNQHLNHHVNFKPTAPLFPHHILLRDWINREKLI